MGSLILAIIAFIAVAVISRIVYSDSKNSSIFLLVLFSGILGIAIHDYIKCGESPKPKATEVYKDAVTLRTDSIIVFLK